MIKNSESDDDHDKKEILEKVHIVDVNKTWVEQQLPLGMSTKMRSTTSGIWM
jgi:hypothetical protein